MLTETEPQGTVTYHYDLAGRRTRMEWPDAEAVVYDWYGGPDLITIGVAGTSNYTVATFVYDSLGRRTVLGGGNGAQSLYSYDAQSALATLTINPWNTADDQTATFTRDAATRIIGRSGTNSAYDWSPGSASPTTYASNGLNQTTSAGGVSLSYDDRGNMTARGSTTYGYDIANHLTSMAVSGTPTASLSYDPVGRLWEVAGAATTRFLYDGADLIAEYDTSGNVLRRYIHGPGTDEPLIWFEGSGTNGIQTLHADERGSVTTVATGSAVAIDINTYDAYGARSSTNPTYASRFGFTGQAWLSDLGLYYYKARMYSPELGRFLQTDPIGYGDGMNIYAYVRNDPVNGRDPSGMEEGTNLGTPPVVGQRETGDDETITKEELCESYRDLASAFGIQCPEPGAAPETPDQRLGRIFGGSGGGQQPQNGASGGSCPTVDIRFTAVGGGQAPDGALGFPPPDGSVAIDPADFGVPYDTIAERASAQSAMRKAYPNFVVDVPALPGTPHYSQVGTTSLSLADVGNKFIRSSKPGVRMDIYRYDTVKDGKEFGAKVLSGTVRGLPPGWRCPGQ